MEFLARWKVADRQSYGTDPLMQLNIYRDPSLPSESKLPVVIFWHGGSWQNGGLWRYDFAGRAFAKMGVIAVLVGYRKYPQVKYPVFIEDAALATTWVAQNIGHYGGDDAQLFVAGHSAGAHTAAALAYQPGYWEKSGLDRKQLKGFIGLSGPYDFYPRPDLRPLFPLNDKTEPWRIGRQLPKKPCPALITHGYLDPIVRISYSKTMVRRLRAARADVSTLYLPVEHLLTLFSFIWPVRLLPWSTWRATRRFIKNKAD